MNDSGRETAQFVLQPIAAKLILEWNAAFVSPRNFLDCFSCPPFVSLGFLRSRI